MFRYLQALVQRGNTFTVTVTDVLGAQFTGSVAHDGLDRHGVVVRVGSNVRCFPWSGIANLMVNL